MKKTLETYECDLCGRDAERFVVTYMDGSMLLDRCEKHNTKLLKFREEKGEWVSKEPRGKATFKLSSPAEIAKQVQNGK